MAATGAEVWQNAVVVEHHRIADDIARIVVEVARPTRVEPGTHLDVRIQLPDGTFDTRSYSIVEGTGGGRRVARSDGWIGPGVGEAVELGGAVEGEHGRGSLGGEAGEVHGAARLTGGVEVQGGDLGIAALALEGEG